MTFARRTALRISAAVALTIAGAVATAGADDATFCAGIAPHYKLRGWRRDKDLLRRFAAGFLPAAVALRPKHIFRAPYSASFLDPAPDWVDQLMSDGALRRTGYFDPARVGVVRARLRATRLRLGHHMRDEVSVVGVLSTQLWHHLFLGGGLCELPTWTPPA
jgi:asparagine synthase (glutamine-hydrolysing)